MRYRYIICLCVWAFRTIQNKYSHSLITLHVIYTFAHLLFPICEYKPFAFARFHSSWHWPFIFLSMITSINSNASRKIGQTLHSCYLMLLFNHQFWWLSFLVYDLDNTSSLLDFHSIYVFNSNRNQKRSIFEYTHWVDYTCHQFIC